MWAALSDERMGLWFTIAAGPCQGSHSRVRVPRSSLLSEVRDSRNLEGQVPVFITHRNRVARLYPEALGSLFVASYDSWGYTHSGYALNRVLLTSPRHGPRKNTSSSIVAPMIFMRTCLSAKVSPSNGRVYLLKIGSLVLNVVSLPASRSLPSNGSTRYNIYRSDECFEQNIWRSNETHFMRIKLFRTCYGFCDN
jgi:hypothetical protein